MTEAGSQFIKKTVNSGSLLLMWLGQSGFAIKSSDGTILLLDPYLTDTISNGYRPYIHARLIPPVLECDDLSDVKAILYTHDHMDHMDPNTVIQLLWKTEAKVVASPFVCEQNLKKVLRVPQDRMFAVEEFETIEIGEIRITAVPANHGPGAIGYVVETEELCLYFCGDTQLLYTMPEIGTRWQIDAAFLCFNGQGGNMDISSAVALAETLGTKCVVPVHYGMYIDNTGNPDNFEMLLKKKVPDIEFRKMKPGESEVFKR